MLSYRHAFHAGNHADVLKHFLLVQLTGYLRQKDAPFWYIDTHAGAGLYALDAGHATKLAEHIDGIGRLWQRKDLPAPLAEYVDLVRALNPKTNQNPDEQLRAYPGSPWLAWQTMREQDRLRLFEMHSSDSRLLQDNFREAGRRVAIQACDGFAGLKALLPPSPRRALVLIDPSYEIKQDYRQVVEAMNDALKRFATGVYAIWYPQLSRPEPLQLVGKLKALPAKRWLHVTLSVATPASDGFGMHGSGMFLINPPWTLHDTLQQVMPYLVEALGRDAGATFTLEQGEHSVD